MEVPGTEVWPGSLGRTRACGVGTAFPDSPLSSFCTARAAGAPVPWPRGQHVLSTGARSTACSHPASLFPAAAATPAGDTAAAHPGREHRCDGRPHPAPRAVLPGPREASRGSQHTADWASTAVVPRGAWWPQVSSWTGRKDVLYALQARGGHPCPGPASSASCYPVCHLKSRAVQGLWRPAAALHWAPGGTVA